jgi:hypothetical protein
MKRAIAYSDHGSDALHLPSASKPWLRNHGGTSIVVAEETPRRASCGAES